MSARDDLAQIITNNRTIWVTNTEHLAMEQAQADAIIAAGYSKPTNEQTAAVTAMAGISEAMDSMFRGQATQQETLNQIAKTLGAYEIERT
ncbi:hypothetical protein FQP90_13720 [Paenarthrobacter nitroguajacolicus]|uniref:Uncharacterized protein n=1 Tax=Paenarthrobacter nitroguajacolicus TaxID=211146 RepID=A0A558GXJ3_PAENT|nr:hypothetical protein [Paenarthrobacter nitroguajacolicus]TVU61594.1 hypothetical protein FQP90_13720 [Paenarthrobacter nitroguajacolicus]